MKKDKHILIGGSGFIAYHLRVFLRKKNCLVLILDKKPPLDLCENEIFFKWDIRKPLLEWPNDFEVASNVIVHHLAAVHFDFQKDFYETNVNGTKNVIEAFRLCRKWIFYSSVATYGDSIESRDECSEQAPTNDYGKSKLIMEKLILEKCKNQELKGKIIIVRPGVVYGEWNFGNVFNLMWLSSRFTPVGLNTNPIKSMAYVKNLVNSTFFALNNSIENKPFIYNYVDYHQLGTQDLLELIAKANGSRALFIPYRLVLILSYLLNFPFKLLGRDFLINPMRVKKFGQPTQFKADKIREFGYDQPFSPVDAVNRTINWISSNEVKVLRREWKATFKD